MSGQGDKSVIEYRLDQFEKAIDKSTETTQTGFDRMNEAQQAMSKCVTELSVHFREHVRHGEITEKITSKRIDGLKLYVDSALARAGISVTPADMAKVAGGVSALSGLAGALYYFLTGQSPPPPPTP